MDKQSLVYLPLLLEKLKSKKIFLVTGKDSYFSSGASSKLLELLNDYQVNRFCAFSTNPAIEDVLQGTNSFNKDKYDIIIAVGGGSVLDMAKLIKAVSSLDEDPEESITQNKKWQIKNIPLIAIPTTFGSGSEATTFAVLYINGAKYSLNNEALLPEYVFLEPEFTFDTPQYIAASCSFDALSQAIEAMWSVHSTAASIQFSTEAITIIMQNMMRN